MPTHKFRTAHRLYNTASRYGLRFMLATCVLALAGQAIVPASETERTVEAQYRSTHESNLRQVNHLWEQVSKSRQQKVEVISTKAEELKTQITNFVASISDVAETKRNFQQTTTEIKSRLQQDFDVRIQQKTSEFEIRFQRQTLEIENRLRKQLEIEIMQTREKEIEARLRTQLKIKITETREKEIENHLRRELKIEITQTREKEIEDRLRRELNTEIMQTREKEIKDRLRTQRRQLKRTLRVQIERTLRVDIRQELETLLRKEKSETTAELELKIFELEELIKKLRISVEQNQSPTANVAIIKQIELLIIVLRGNLPSSEDTPSQPPVASSSEDRPKRRAFGEIKPTQRIRYGNQGKSKGVYARFTDQCADRCGKKSCGKKLRKFAAKKYKLDPCEHRVDCGDTFFCSDICQRRVQELRRKRCKCRTCQRQVSK